MKQHVSKNEISWFPPLVLLVNIFSGIYLFIIWIYLWGFLVGQWWNALKKIQTLPTWISELGFVFVWPYFRSHYPRKARAKSVKELKKRVTLGSLIQQSRRKVALLRESSSFLGPCFAMWRKTSNIIFFKNSRGKISQVFFFFFSIFVPFLWYFARHWSNFSLLVVD